MEVPSQIEWLWRRLGRTGKAFLLSLAAYLISGWAGVGGATRLILLLLLAGTGAFAAVCWLRLGIRKAIWRLRHRLLVAYLFIAVVPILLIVTLAGVASIALSSQLAIYLVNSELDRRMEVLGQSAQMLVRVPTFQRERTWERARSRLERAFPELNVVIEDGNRVRFPTEPAFEAPPEGWGELTGVVVRDGLLHAWSRAIEGNTEVTLMAPLTTEYLNSLAPGIGDVTILEFSEAGETLSPRQVMRPHGASTGGYGRGGSVLPPPKNRLDLDIKQGTSLPVAVWDSPPTEAGGLLSIHSRFSAVLDVIFRQTSESGQMLFVVYFLAVVFLIVELIALAIGVSLTRTITGAFNNLYEGTERVREGDFSHRIEVRGADQIAEVSDSFNKMTENLKNLLGVAKEKERMQAELEIARAVQRQLYPKSVPSLDTLELRAVCNPARMVSGDYYDYQLLVDSRIAIVIGDVAGKGISAALLMASLQSSLLTHIRLCGEPGNGEMMSSSRLVARLNEQLYAHTSPEKYATFFFSIYDDKTGVLTYTNAGHLPPVLVRGGKATELDVNGMVVGAFPFAQYGESQVRLEPGDLLLAYTDGITEPENAYGEMFGEQRATEIAVKNAHRSADEIVSVLIEAVREWTGSPELQDDMTILVARRH